MTRSYALEAPEEVARELRRLRIQAEALFPLESAAMDQLGVPEPRVVLDVGCGIGAYSACLRRKWPRARVVGVDRHEGLLASADGENICANVLEGVPDVGADLVVLRLVLQHLTLSEREQLVASIRAPILVIETDVTTFRAASPAVRELARRLNEEVARRGGDRTLGARAVPGARTVAVRVSPETIGWKAWLSIHWPVWRACCDDLAILRDAWADLRADRDVSSELFVGYRG